MILHGGELSLHEERNVYACLLLNFSAFQLNEAR